MILLSKNGKSYRCFAAFIADLDDRRQVDVATKADVLAFLQKQPDKHFLLICAGEHLHETSPAEQDAVYCGVVKWNSKDRTLYAKPLTFQN